MSRAIATQKPNGAGPVEDQQLDVEARASVKEPPPAAQAERENPDRALMQRVQQGDDAAFDKVVETHQKSVHAFLQARLLTAADADDLTQEVFLRCYQARARFDTDSLLRPFLMGIARNVLREHARRLKRRKEVIWTELCLELENQEQTDDPLYDDVLGHLPECLDTLGEPARKALDMHYRHRMQHATIGQRLGRSVGAIKLLLFRARRALKRCLDRKLSDSGDD